MKILVTGAAGFIGSQLTKRLLRMGMNVFGIDNLNEYYDINLKYDRLRELKKMENFDFIKLDIADEPQLKNLFDTHDFDVVFNLAAQAGVRYSIDNPYIYLRDNIEGFLNILENCRHHDIHHLIYASSSSVYGSRESVPCKENENTSQPMSFYAATKKSDELMAYAYSSLYHIHTTGIRFFTVYGPWGRPDMAPYKFMNHIIHDEEIEVYNNGMMIRDFTYIDDLVEGLIRLMEYDIFPTVPYRIYNIGKGHPASIMELIRTIENITEKKARMKFMPMQAGDMRYTRADITHLVHDTNFVPSVSLREGISKMYDWYLDYNR